MSKNHTYGQILKSSAMIGGSSVLKIAIGIVRTKAMAILLGPSGVGLMGLYGSITDLTNNMAGMGINNSGVRQIAAAVGSGDTENIALTATVLRRISIFLGAFGAAFLILFSGPVSTFTFGNDQHAFAVALLSLVVFFGTVSAGQEALIQGMRCISDMAKMGILGALFGTLISITVIYFLREEGVAPSLVLIAAMSLLTSWWYSRKIPIQTPSISASQLGQEAGALLKLGFAFMVSGLLMAGAGYAVRLIVVREVGYDAAGLYQAAWALGGLYIGLILQAMGADFYPRLTAIANDNTECNRMVNEQAHVSLLLAGPGVLATLTFAPLVIGLFYTPKFEGAVEILRWLCLGMTLRVISWPMGFIINAKGVQNLIIFSELAWAVVYLGLAWVCVSFFNLKGAGIAFFGSYIFHVLMIYLIVRRLSGFRWSTSNIHTSFLFLALIAVVFCSFYTLPSLLALGVGTLAVLLSGVYSIQVLLNLIPINRIPRSLLNLFRYLRLVSINSSEYNDLQSVINMTIGDTVVQNKLLVPLNRLIFAYMICIVFFMWVYWYAEMYGWSGRLLSFESGLGHLLKSGMLSD
ncbi:O-antigen translocase [Methylomicrobium sp. Wu6]|uniref:O-antigen translocase n=1 Tax=Methylomicrobium sp. Wu6 TaxID=3107928 RepID=UPI002DD69E6D|nr:O-antigen translocase [Methylomicrobium sp. Wu6]MEC4747008.1 O-antigen translocase [Methylomicrobium sp. Wu6]